jgi:serine/threonine-protein kinase HipA
LRIKPGTPLRVAAIFGTGSALPVGRLALDRGVTVLEYSAEFIASGLTLNPILPAPARGLIRPKTPSHFGGLHGFLADSLPDAWGTLLLKRRAEEQGIPYSSLTVLDRLAIIGKRGGGALIYEPETARARGGSIDLDALSPEVDKLIAGQETSALAELQELGGPSGGARPKVLVAINQEGSLVAPGDGALPPGYEAWLVKFRSRNHDFEDIGPLEAAYADMAREAGLDVSITRLIPSAGGGPGYFATKRFDRLPRDGRVHFISVAGMLDTDWEVPTIDYNELMKLGRHVTKSHEAVERLFTRMSFNVLAHNRDDHAKQHGFLMNEKGEWALAPAYDLTHSRGPGGEHYLAVKGRSGDDITIDLMTRLGEEHGVSKATYSAIIERTADAVSRFEEFAQRYDVSRSTTSQIQRSLNASLARLSGHAIPAVDVSKEESDVDLQQLLDPTTLP